MRLVHVVYIAVVKLTTTCEYGIMEAKRQRVFEQLYLVG